MQNLSTGTWASIDECCPVRCDVDGSDLALLVLGENGHTVELICNADGLRKLAAASSRAVAEMDALFKQEGAARESEASAEIEERSA